MPLYMDIHILDGGFTMEYGRKAHLEDLAIQEKYGVKYLQYWYNEETRTVYYLMEGPDKESCVATHREAARYTECQIMEVKGGVYDLFTKKNQISDHGNIRRIDNKPDTGYRYILTLDIIKTIKNAGKIDFDQLKLPAKPKKRVLQYISEFKGEEVRTQGFDKITAVFDTPEKVLKCARKIQNDFLADIYNPNAEVEDLIFNNDLIFNLGISVGQLPAEKENYFAESIRMSRRLCLSAGDFEIVSTGLFENLCDLNNVVKKHISLRIINPGEQEFLNNLVDTIENNLANHTFGVDYLSHAMGISQPQLYRKVFAITGRPPVTFIRDIRLNKSLILIKENKHNISEIALEVGYNNPSYFSTCFQQKFGVKASQIVV